MTESRQAQQVRERYGVPDAVRLRVDRREVLAYVPECEVAVRRVAARPDDLPPSPFGGRGALARLGRTGAALLVRPYRKGGLLRRLRGGRFRGSWRPLSELVLHRRLAALGVPVVEAVGCVVLRGVFGWRGFLLTREVPDAIDLEAWLHGQGDRPDRAPARVLQRGGRAVRRLHDAGVAHRDLHPKNMLVAAGGAVLLLDLDRASSAGAPLDDRQRLANLVRLGRAIEKHRLKGLTTGRREALRFLEGYAGSREAAGAWLARVRARLRRGLGLRILWWRLIGEARPWQGPRAARAAVATKGDAP